MIVQFGTYKLDIDVERTRQFYQSQNLLSDSCSCQGCRNFVAAVDELPKAVLHFFDALGIDMRKMVEVYVNTSNPDGTLFYGGFCHLSGTLISGDSAWVARNEVTKYWDDDRAYLVAENFSVSFQKDCHLLETGFPLPAVQMEIMANIPFVLDEENAYQ